MGKTESNAVPDRMLTTTEAEKTTYIDTDIGSWSEQLGQDGEYRVASKGGLEKSCTSCMSPHRPANFRQKTTEGGPTVDRVQLILSEFC